MDSLNGSKDPPSTLSAVYQVRRIVAAETETNIFSGSVLQPGRRRSGLL